MSTIPENGLPTEVSTDVEEMQLMFVRLLDATGRSKKKLLSQIKWKLANVFGLETALDTKIAKKATGFPDRIAKFLTNGDIDISNFGIGSFSSLALLDAYDVNGFAVAEGTGPEYVHPIMGTITSLILMNNQEFIFTSDRGIWFRTNTGSSWTYPVYVGGAAQNIVVTYAEAETLVADGSLSVGAVYSIEDFDVTGYTKIILTAATASSFFEDGYAFLPVPKYRWLDYPNNTVSIGGTDYYVVGNWQFLTLLVYNHSLCYAYGKVYITDGTTLGTVTDWILDSNWTYMHPSTYPELYLTEQHTVQYDFTNNYVRRETNKNNVTCGETITIGTDDGFQTRFNDWATGSENGKGFNDYKNIRCRRMTKMYNNDNGYGAGTHVIGLSEIDITGDIENCHVSNDSGSTDSAMTGIYGDGSIKNLGTALRAGGFSGTLKNGAVLDGYEFSDNAKWNIEADLDATGTPFLNATKPQYLTLPKGQICGSYTVSGGTFTISSIESKGLDLTSTVTKGVENGVKVDTTNRRFIVQVAGYYEFYVNTSAGVSAAATVDTFVPAAIDDFSEYQSKWYNHKRYVNNESIQTTSLPVIPAWLDVGAEVEIYYVSTANVTVTLEWMTAYLKYVGI